MAIEKDQFGFRATSQASLLASQGKDWFESASNSNVQSLCNCNAGRASNVIDDVERATGWVNNRSRSKSHNDDGKETARPRLRKPKGFLSLRIESWLDDQLDRPDGGWTPETIEPFIVADTSAWNRKIGQCGAEELAAFEAWLGAAATLNRRNEQRTIEINAQLQPAVKKYVGKAIESLNEFQTLAHTTCWNNDERVYRIQHALSELKSAFLDFGD